MKLVKVKIDQNGNMSMDFIGFKGRQCDIAEKNLLKILNDLKIKKEEETYKKTDQLLLEEQLESE